MSDEAQDTGSVYPITIEEEVQKSYLTYAMSVIVSRALPDVRDGLKPVHRRILYSMNDMGLHNNRQPRKAVRVVGDVLAKYHPHGDQSVYDALVRMAQDFSLREPMIEGQGNFGSIDGDPPAAMRYTEARLSAISEAMLRDLKKDTVDFRPNFDDSEREPVVLPGAMPFLLVNGASGIAVGMATNMAPHNLGEVCRATCALIANPQMGDEELLSYVTGPDFPTGGIICGMRGARQAYLQGKGQIIMRSRHRLETLHGEREAIIVTEIPYMVNKANMVMKIAELVRDKRIEGIADLRDESDRNGIRIVIELKKGMAPEVLLNQLYSLSPLQSSFHINNLALDHGRPKLFTLREMISAFLAHRFEVQERRIRFDLGKAKDRVHILEGLKIALDNIDAVIELIRSSSTVEEAREGLIRSFALSERQAVAILEMRLQRLTGMEVEKIVAELNELYRQIVELEDFLAHSEKIYALIGDETRELGEKYGTPRCTDISPVEVDGSISLEDLIQEEEMVVLISHQGFIKRIPASEYKEQSRGGKGVRVSQLRDDDFVEHIFTANTHHYILFVSTEGKAYYLKVYELPEGSKTSKGKHVRNLFPFEENEDITAYVVLPKFEKDTYLFMATQRGVVKRVSTHEFRNARVRGIRAIELDEGDHLVGAELTDGGLDLLVLTRRGKGLRFNEGQIRVTGRTARGVRGIRLKDEDRLISVCCQHEEHSQLLLISENGIGKRMTFNQFTPHARGTQGQRSYTINNKTGALVDVKTVRDEDAAIVTTEKGKAIRIPVGKVSSLGRTASGVRLLRAGEGDKVAGLAIIGPQEEDEQDEQDDAGHIHQAELSEPGMEIIGGDENLDDTDLEGPDDCMD
ncbi:DNA topoisomerase (ATP-hydrolyzing) subunit A [Candidatus Haliotispira prima]|uniref:DNA gyrase subunit A n=1 Tax=Candidatus Haliotispira prima TaxID=3034016 RepID=A0ABY8MGG0_9SPIO|nr:DNA topoisomerase (ATP-hydrolyzing) subunit A [Candidatus Haliotispira prima]